MFKRLLLAGLVLLALIVMWTVPAFAADAVTTDYAVNLKPMLDVVVSLLAALMLGVGTWAINMLAGWLKLQNDSVVRGYLTTTLHAAIDFAMAKANALESDLADLKVQNSIVAEAANFVAAHVPDALTYFGVDEDALARMLVARLPVPTAVPAPVAAPAS